MVALRIDSDAGELSFFSTVTTFGTAVDITVSELSIEAFFPADATDRRGAPGAWPRSPAECRPRRVRKDLRDGVDPC